MDDNNRNVQHPLLVALRIFDVAVRTAFDTAVTFWTLWSGKREKQEAPARQQQSNAPSEQAPQPINRDQATAEEKKPKAPIKRARSRKPLAQGATVEKPPKAPTKRSLKREQELEREERAQKTERLRKLRLAKEAGEKKDQP
jgi:type IV secretory pathway VirB10-like protein